MSSHRSQYSKHPDVSSRVVRTSQLQAFRKVMKKLKYNVQNRGAAELSRTDMSTITTYLQVTPETERARAWSQITHDLPNQHSLIAEQLEKAGKSELMPIISPLKTPKSKTQQSLTKELSTYNGLLNRYNTLLEERDVAKNKSTRTGGRRATRHINDKIKI